MFLYDGLDFTGYDRCARASAALVRCQGAGSPTILYEPPYPAPNGRPADTEFPNCIADALSKLPAPARYACTSGRKTAALRAASTPSVPAWSPSRSIVASSMPL